jgi:diadenosine tetraphosphate (Ap4A) HIT family hydrolase
MANLGAVTTPELPAYPRAVLAAIRAAEQDGRLPAPTAETLGDIFPFESPVSVVSFDEPTVPEPDRQGEDQADCAQCANPDEKYLWTSASWRLRAPDRPFAVHTLLLEPRAHVDQADLTPELASELGPLLVRIERAVISAVDGVGRVHLNRWGDGGAHLHWWIIVRPAGLLQLRGSALPLWLDVLPPLPEDVWRSDLQRIAKAIG